jgi:hypothetical protein
MRSEQPNCGLGAQQSPIIRQFPNQSRLPIKAAADRQNIFREVRQVPATLVAAQALAICPLPHTKQNQKCL